MARDWTRFDVPQAGRSTFDSGAIAGLPDPVRRWLVHAVAEGTPLPTSVELVMHGEIRIGRWAPFTAVQRLSVDDGFVWAATARPLGVPVVGFDRWTRGTGEMRWRLLGAIPMISAAGEDVSRSAAGRHAGELLVSLPTAAIGPSVSWRPRDSARAVAAVQVGTARHEVTVTVGPDGVLTELGMDRWGAVGRGPFGLQRFGATFEGQVSAGGVRVPRRITAGWHHGTDRWPEGQFIRWTVDGARYR